MSALSVILIFIGGCAVGICILMGFFLYLSSKIKHPTFQDVEYNIECEHDFQTKYAFTGEILVCRYCKWTIIDSNLIEGQTKDKMMINNLLEKLNAPVRIAITSFDDSAT